MIAELALWVSQELCTRNGSARRDCENHYKIIESTGVDIFVFFRWGCFYLDGCVNTQNNRFWSRDIPHL
jgi:hypothetical protein